MCTIIAREVEEMLLGFGHRRCWHPSTIPQKRLTADLIEDSCVVFSDRNVTATANALHVSGYSQTEAGRDIWVLHILARDTFPDRVHFVTFLVHLRPYMRLAREKYDDKTHWTRKNVLFRYIWTQVDGTLPRTEDYSLSANLQWTRAQNTQP